MKTKYHFDYDTPLTPELSEFIGAFIGDGFTNKYGSTYVIQITGDARLDREYYQNCLKPIIMTLCPDANPKIRKIENALRLTTNSKEFFILLTERFHLTSGKKTYDVTIPQEILENRLCLHKCIRGIFDTDGCVFVDKRSSYREPYIRICLEMESKKLVEQVFYSLMKIGIECGLSSDSKRIQINGARNCRQFVEKIGFSNNRHTNKLKKWLH